MKEAIKHDCAKIGDELLGSGIVKGNCFPQGYLSVVFLQPYPLFFFFFPFVRNEYVKPLLEISACPAEAKLQQHKGG